MQFTVKATIEIVVEATHVSGRFSSRAAMEEAIQDQMQDQIDGLNVDFDLSGLNDDGDNEYDVQSEITDTTLEVTK